MCTSFVLYADKSYIGMNFDISARPIKLTHSGKGGFLVSQKDGPAWHPAFGCNRYGTFMNMQMVDPVEAGNYRRGKDCVHIHKLFVDILSGSWTADGLEKLLQSKTVVNVPGYSVHSMIAMPNRRAWVVEPGRGILRLDAAERNFLVLTCFPLSDFTGRDCVKVKGAGADRYKTVYPQLMESGEAFHVNRGLGVLQAVTQPGGEFPTQFSMISVMEDEKIYFTLSRNFDRQYEFSFRDGMIRTGKGFESPQELTLDGKGILLSDLKAWW
jgi:hypothetical protein